MVTAPTPTQFKERYVEFTPVSDPRVTIFLTEALRSVDDSWLEADQQPAIMALAAHNLSLEGEPALSNGTVVTNQNGRYLKSRKVGDVTNEWAESESQKSGSTAQENSYRSTVYGAKFYQLMKLNHTGMRVV